MVLLLCSFLLDFLTLFLYHNYMLSTILILYLVFNAACISLNFYFSLLLIFPSYSLLSEIQKGFRNSLLFHLILFSCHMFCVLIFLLWALFLNMSLKCYLMSETEVILFPSSKTVFFLYAFLTCHFLPLLTFFFFSYSFHTVSVLAPFIWHFALTEVRFFSGHMI